MDQRFAHSGTLDPSPTPRERENAALARQAAAEGIVLLKNRGVLPLCPGTPVALFGAGAGRTVKGGTGSGDVNNRASVSIWQGLQEAGVPLTSEDWLDDYEARYTRARESWRDQVLAAAKLVDNPFDAYAAHPFALPQGRAIRPQDLAGAKAALYVISRIAGEGKDRRLEPGDYYLSDAERADLRALDESGLPVVLLLNAGGPVELTDLLAEYRHPLAVLQISQPGQQGGEAVADILLGKAVPEGKLTATWAKRYADYPCADTFGACNGDLEKEDYAEGLYVGYRWFDSFGIEPLFGFGHGLSYTTFSTAFTALRPGDHGVEVDLTVTNTGDRFTGREVAQLYAACPQTGTAREYRRLAGFAKTRPLAPGESQTVTIAVPAKQLAEFLPGRGAWVIPAGVYTLFAGGSLAEAAPCAHLTVDVEVVLEITHPICPLHHPFGEVGTAALAMEKAAAAAALDLPAFVFAPLPDEAPAPAPVPLADGPVEELVPMLYGNITKGASTLGSAGIRVPGSAGETSEALEASRQIPSLIMADGPAGLRLRQSYQADRATGEVYGAGVLGSLENGFLEAPPRHEGADTYYQFCTAFPVGTALAQSWDPELLTRVGRAVSREMDEFHVDLWLAPGMNIQRNPLCGRNFEYYSEDPLLTGTLAAAITAGVQESGRHGVTLKHFACNNQEDNRMAVDARVPERTLREIYLRGFEIAVKTAAPAAVMSAYNCINGVHAANSRDLCTVVLRQEWGFAGLVMSDWNTTVPDDGSEPWRCAWAGNDVIMPGNPHDDADIRAALADGRLAETDVRACAGRLIALAAALRRR
ncbi:glycoside hydrolase family 3 C-terminal domain-containing protein [uncultured Subdoligranulum sp.]|uniref:glycoside hydrolase family 3 protein n=1 Tax=uncultured Subdoligranulum sp. TaxID=512298 RepID=UPI002608DCEB|nr:glycoside hydrolase family 3 protein [uncultured Subdoligranulum sp.]